MKKATILFLALSFGSFLYAQENPPDKNSNLKIEKRVEDLLNRMTPEEKIDLLGGTGFATKSNARLGIPELRMTDGPVGVRWGASTAFPVSIAMAATWNPQKIEEVGKALGREVRGKDRHVLLGPCVNIVRIPQGGRNFESFGEDPFLTSRIAVDYIKGIQKEGVAATIKHFAVNNQEYQRTFVNAIVSERALNEIYLPHFKAAVKEADVLCVMSSYNKINGTYASENDYLLIDKLKKEWKFKGLIMSDWGAVHSSIPTAKSGLDLEMPVGFFLNKKNLLDEIKKDNIHQAAIDDKVKRILGVMFKLNLFDKETKEDSTLVNSESNRKTAYETSLESIVLLKNEGNILPLQKDKIKSIAVIGPNAAAARTGGGGSALVDPINPISALQGLRNKIDGKIKINYAPGLKLDGDLDEINNKYFFTDQTQKQNGLAGEYYNNLNLEGEPILKRVDKTVYFNWHGGKPANDIKEDNFSVRWTGYIKAPMTGPYLISVTSDDGTRLFINDELVIDNWSDHALTTAVTKVRMEEGKLYKIKLEYYENGGDAAVIMGWKLPGEDLIKDAVTAAKNSDVAILFVGTTHNIETEGRDREDLILPNGQDELIEKVVEANPKTIVVLLNGSPVLMENWVNKVKGIVEAWFPGVEGGNAIADVLVGNYNPSGKLPITFPKKWEDCSAVNSYKAEDGTVRYDDGIFIGYRHFDKNNIEPLFPFGYGLSYTTFSYGDLKISEKVKSNYEISFVVKNIGSVKGAEVAQVYVSQINPSVERPVKELKGFKKVELNPGQNTSVKLNLKQDDFAYYDENVHGWKVDKGKYKITVGGFSRDLKLVSEIEIK